MSSSDQLKNGLSVGDLMQRHPETIAVFLNHGMLCVGCSVNLHHTIDEVCAVYGYSPDVLRRDLCLVIRENARSRRTRPACAAPSQR